MHRTRTLLIVLAAIGALGASVAPSIGAGGPTVPLSIAPPAWANAANSRGAVAPDESITVSVFLQLRDVGRARELVAALSDPTSERYGQYVSAAQFRAEFAPTREQVDAVRSWLLGAGLTIDEIPDNARYVRATGSAAQVGAAFGTRFDAYQVRGRRAHAPHSSPAIPASVAPVVLGVSGLTTPTGMRRPDHVVERPLGSPSAAMLLRARPEASPDNAPPPAGFRNAPPCSPTWGAALDTTSLPYGGGYPAPLPYAPCGLTPPQLRSAYGVADAVAAGTDGRGVRVAIIDAYAAKELYADAAAYAKQYDPAFPLPKQQFSTVVFRPDHTLEGPDECDASGWYGEQTLDVEAVHATAPGAKIVYVGASSCLDADLDAALNRVVDRHLADIVSNSYGNAGEDVDPLEIANFDAITLQAAAQGIGLYFSSGDDGDEAAALRHATPDFPATSSYVTAVGGTSLGVAAGGTVAVEQGWETGISDLAKKRWKPGPPGDFLYGSGGGTSRVYAQPAYQRGVVPDVLAARNKRFVGRVVPDVAMLADPNTGMLVGETQTFSDGTYFDVYRIGGTSLACPLFAGMMALADQRAGHAHGLANAALYGAYGTAAYRDIAPGAKTSVVRVNFTNGENSADGLNPPSVRTFDYPKLKIHTAVGYDDVTGMGAPNGEGFLDALP